MFKSIFSVFSKEATTPKPSNVKPVVLMIMDGFGIAPPSEGNAVNLAKKPNINSFYSLYPHGELIASGESVGLPANEVGNTEVGHLTLGTGRVIDQDLVRINKSIKNGSFDDNKAFLQVVDHLKKHNSRLHVMGLVGGGNVHSSIEHFWALVDFCKKNKMKNVCFHLFTDGRDSPPQDGVKVIEKIDTELRASRVGFIATVSGRYFAMDRDGRWDRTKKAYDAITLGQGVIATSAPAALRKSYQEGKTDEFIEPTVMVNDQGQPLGIVNDNDAAIMFNFRIDRPRQLTMSFVLPNFETIKEFEFGEDPEKEGKETGVVKFVTGTFKRQRIIKNLYFVTMTEYQERLKVSAIAFPKIIANSTLAECLSKNNLLQMHMSESEKERFVTYYFNGQREIKFPGEEWDIVPSQKVATYDLRPQMSVFDIVREFKNKSNLGRYNFFVMNLANADMVGHTGNIQACVKAVEYLDKAVGEIVAWTLALNGTVLITADHGNAEEMLSYPTTSFFITTEKGKVNTDHSNNPVPIFIISQSLRGKTNVIDRGSLGDVAPTILDIFKIPKPPEMTGNSLISGLSL
jgi:2,3-bisphosphoglycerate-independent phosphoglycerate mutase